MFSFLRRSNEISLCLKALDASKAHLGQFSSFVRVHGVVKERIKKSEKAIVEAVKNGANPEVIAVAEVTNISGDFVESGDLCIYRGVLSPIGQDMLNLHKAAYQRMVELGATTQGNASLEIEALINNLRMVG